PALAHLEQNLFAQAPQVWEKPCPELGLFEADGPRREAEYAASLILRLVREKGWRFRDFIVTARQFEGYAAQVESVFAQCGIPLFLSTVTDILEKPVLTLITAALDTVSGGYRQEDLFRYLKTGLTDLEDDRRDKLENYALTWNLRGSRWTAQADWIMHPAGYGQSFRAQDERALEELNASRRQVVEPLERFRKNRDKTGRGYTLALYRLLEEIRLPGRLEERAAELERAGERKLADEYRQLWDILTGAMEQCALLLEGREMKLDEFSSLFKLVLSQYNVGTIPVSLDRVSAGDAPRLAHRQAKFLIFLGADDGSLPAVSPDPGLFSDRERELLAEQGLELAPRREEKLGREMSLVYAVCAVPSHGLLVSWSRQGEGEQRRPSFLAERLRALYPQIRRERENPLELETPGLALARAGQEPEAAAALERIPAYRERVGRVLHAADVKRDSLSRQAVEGLYGALVPMSATRMDACRSCHFSYFMRYGLRARERQKAGFHAPEYGSFVHAVLERVLNAASGGDGREIRELVQEAVSSYIDQSLGGMERETPRFRWLFLRLLDTVTALAENAVEELKASHFRPLAFELGFGPGKPLPAIRVERDGLTLSVSGYVDRVDGWERDGTLYLRVIDYKTGRKAFNFTDIQNGMSLQMLLYLFALEKRGFQGKPVQGAGVLYVHARPVDIPGQPGLTEGECRARMERELRREGLVLDDEAVLRAMEDWGTGKPRFLPVAVDRTGALKSDYLVSAEQLGRLSRKVTDTLKDIAGEVAAGNIAADPYWRSSAENACRFCDYRQACHFESCFGDKKQWQRPVSPRAFWEALENEQEGGEEHGLSAD
ncbi:MAG: PD-(D/E)XK nuclease family protein, partial [Oscillospiraceae bacterium]|nr:PD-(D/E)XK nuclease family protein [Oscillospiraceae bacterium]